MNAEILSVGTELLLGEILDTNAQYLSARLKDVGIDVYHRVTVGDNLHRLSEAFRTALGRADIVIASGGLGPTDDDVTASALSQVLGRPLLFNEKAWEDILKWLKKRGRGTGENSDRKQALIIEGATVLPNAVGTAPGQAIFWGGKLAVILPGPPSEMIPMFENQVVPLIRRLYPDLHPLLSTNLKLVGISEARVGEIVKDLMESSNPTLAPYVNPGEVRLRIAAKGNTPEESLELLRSMEEKVRSRLGEFIYGKDDETLEEVVGNLLTRKGLTLAVAESVTGGLLCHRITGVPGSSRYLKMGVIAYSPKIKVSCLGVSVNDVNRNEAVNREVAESMARGVRDLAGADIGLATTGFAGPGGGTEEEPVGTVYVGYCYKDKTFSEREVYQGQRDRVKLLASQKALHCLFKLLKSI